ncbi:MAG: ACT domain-containing protein, partial [Thermoflexales bacterium]|nr:ACT domain-containing protein [Thermoflexales bacterium]
TSVFMISQASSEQNICFVIPRQAVSAVVDALRREFETEIAHGEIDGVYSFDQASIITVVGAGIAETPGVSGRVFSALGAERINVFAIAQGSSECAISLIVAEDRCDDAVRALHRLTESSSAFTLQREAASASGTL